PNTVNFKLGASFHYKVAPHTEAIFAAYWGTGNTIYTGSERYSLRGFKMGQYKLELANRYWTLRAYTTQENAGESYNTTVATRLVNEAWYPSGGATGWFSIYAQNYLAQRLAGVQDSAAHAAARAVVDANRPLASSARFKALTDSIRSTPISKGGALLLDKSDLYSLDGSYNLSHLRNKLFNIDFLVGGNYKTYVLNSEGTLFADTSGKIKVAEYGGFLQASRKVIKNVTLTASGRYDKNENFEGKFTPRVTAVIKYGANTNFRLSYQTAYRFPSNQQQYINLVVGSNVRLIGGNPGFRTLFNFTGKPLYDFEALRKGTFTPYTPVDLKPESLTSFEGGWKGLLLKGKLLIDLYGYVGKYKDFLGRKVYVQSLTGTNVVLADTATGYRYSIPNNAPDKVKTFGYGISIDYRMPWNFVVGGNISSDNLKDVPVNFVAYFNSPKYKGNFSIGNLGFGHGKRFGFMATYRFQQSYYYQGDFATDNLPAVQTVDGQVSYKFPAIKSIFKVGATNLLNQYYYNAVGNSRIGGLYYIGFAYNVY
ncbi:MAG TPA: TonB-dependent receptor, partial [Ferruginibacter sp.]|nr:TonB-dependent receptor [Ferruginibacter sp.]